MEKYTAENYNEEQITTIEQNLLEQENIDSSARELEEQLINLWTSIQEYDIWDFVDEIDDNETHSDEESYGDRFYEKFEDLLNNQDITNIQKQKLYQQEMKMLLNYVNQLINNTREKEKKQFNLFTIVPGYAAPLEIKTQIERKKIKSLEQELENLLNDDYIKQLDNDNEEMREEYTEKCNQLMNKLLQNFRLVDNNTRKFWRITVKKKWWKIVLKVLERWSQWIPIILWWWIKTKPVIDLVKKSGIALESTETYKNKSIDEDTIKKIKESLKKSREIINNKKDENNNLNNEKNKIL